MITTPTRSSRRRARRGAFTLVEVIIGSTISAMILAGVMSAFLMLGRSGANIASYAESDAQIRRGLEEFAQDVRMASNVTWNSTTSVTLTVPGNYASNSNLVTYACDLGAGTFARSPGDPAVAGGTRTYVRNIVSFSFKRYNRIDGAASSDAETKRIRIILTARQSGRTLVSANTMLVTASYTLRNKAAN